MLCSGVTSNCNILGLLGLGRLTRDSATKPVGCYTTDTPRNCISRSRRYFTRSLRGDDTCDLSCVLRSLVRDDSSRFRAFWPGLSGPQALWRKGTRSLPAFMLHSLVLDAQSGPKPLSSSVLELFYSMDKECEVGVRVISIICAVTHSRNYYKTP